MRSRCSAWASELAWWTERSNEVPSSTKKRASTMYPTTKSSAGVGGPQLAHPVDDRHRAPGDEEPERREQRPHVRLTAVAERAGGPGPADGWISGWPPRGRPRCR